MIHKGKEKFMPLDGTKVGFFIFIAYFFEFLNFYFWSFSISKIFFNENKVMVKVFFFNIFSIRRCNMMLHPLKNGSMIKT